MENIIANLTKDHDDILKLTYAMEYMVKKQTKDIEDFQTIVFLIKNFADDYHHAKEEKIIFPLLKNNANKQDVMIPHMLNDHATSRNMTSNLIKAIEVCNNNDDSYYNIYENMISYIIHIRTHIEFENKILYPFTEALISDKEKQDLLNLFKKVDSSQFCGTIISDCIKSIHRLCDKYRLQPTFN